MRERERERDRDRERERQREIGLRKAHVLMWSASLPSHELEINLTLLE